MPVTSRFLETATGVTILALTSSASSSKFQEIDGKAPFAASSEDADEIESKTADKSKDDEDLKIAAVRLESNDPVLLLLLLLGRSRQSVAGVWDIGVGIGLVVIVKNQAALCREKSWNDIVNSGEQTYRTRLTVRTSKPAGMLGQQMATATST
jgi:hypothetical protein